MGFWKMKSNQLYITVYTKPFPVPRLVDIGRQVRLLRP